MKILLVNPSSPNIARISRGFDLGIDFIGHFPPLGLISLASFIRSKSNHEIEVLDCNALRAGPEKVLDTIEKGDFKCIGITAFTYTFYDVLELVRAIKKKYPHMPVVVGGCHILHSGDDTLFHKEIDYVVRGEGEEPFLYLLNCLSENKKPEQRDGLGFHTENGYFLGNPTLIKDLNELPLPAYDLLDEDLYHSTIGDGGKTLTLCTSRGCPFQCTFCQIMSRNYRMNSIDYIMRIIKMHYKTGYRNFYFFDDTFNITDKRIIEFSKAIQDEQLNIKWYFRGRVNSITDEVCREASKAGCEHIIFGVEDYTDENLKLIKKNLTIDMVKNAIRLTRKYKIKSSTNWIIGLPTHKSMDDLRSLLKKAIEINSDYAMFSILAVLPGSDLFDQVVEEGAINKDTWSNFIRNPVSNYQIEFYDKYLNAEEVSNYLSEIHTRYYRRIGYMINQALKIKSFKQLCNQVPIALRVLMPQWWKKKRVSEE